ncbi:hypothetical protein B0H11DRAFT_1915480 [Mycena galericulata]|nr:hypothetical protein B0H11DRAFT_1915480 [Mycena galericulata]
MPSNSLRRPLLVSPSFDGLHRWTCSASFTSNLPANFISKVYLRQVSLTLTGFGNLLVSIPQGYVFFNLFTRVTIFTSNLPAKFISKFATSFRSSHGSIAFFLIFGTYSRLYSASSTLLGSAIELVFRELGHSRRTFSKLENSICKTIDCVVALEMCRERRFWPAGTFKMYKTLLDSVIQLVCHDRRAIKFNTDSNIVRSVSFNFAFSSFSSHPAILGPPSQSIEATSTHPSQIYTDSDKLGRQDLLTACESLGFHPLRKGGSRWFDFNFNQNLEFERVGE